jgi:hypothetical protein
MPLPPEIDPASLVREGGNPELDWKISRTRAS